MVALKHTIWTEGEETVYFYDGELTAKDGVLEVPSDRPEWVQRAWIMGYRLDPETGENIPNDVLLASLDEPAGEEDGKDSSNRGRSVAKDGVRTSKPSRRKRST